MKKLIIAIMLTFLIPLFAGCEVSNTELANSLEGNMTRLVYSVGYLDSVSTEDLTGLVNNSSYFTHSSLYTGDPIEDEEPVEENANNGVLGIDETENALSGGLTTGTSINSGRTAFQNTLYRSSTYTSGLDNVSVNGGYSAGTVDMSLLETNASDLNEILLDISGKRGIIMLYCTDLRSGRATLSIEDKTAISEYNDIIKETTNFLNNNTGMLTNYFNGISSISGNENSAELINAKLIRANEVLKTRYAKLDTCLDSLNAIINILVNSIGYDYAQLYNASLLNNSTLNNVPNEDNLTNFNTFGNEVDPEFSLNENNMTVGDGTATDNMTCPTCPCPNTETCPTCPCPNTTTNVSPNTTNNNVVTNSNTNNENLNNTITPGNSINNGSSTITNPERTNGDTIINYNYDGGNTSNINNTPTTNGANVATNLENTKQNHNDIALSGGLIKNQNTEKIPPENVDSMIAKVSLTKPTSLEFIDKKHESVEEVKLGTPMERKTKKTQDEVTTTPPVVDFSEPEIVESERELTPELLPFAGDKNQPNTLELTPLPVSPELGNITFLPFVYEETDVTRKIPRQ